MPQLQRLAKRAQPLKLVKKAMRRLLKPAKRVQLLKLVKKAMRRPLKPAKKAQVMRLTVPLPLGPNVDELKV
jgi:hypothetical protein